MAVDDFEKCAVQFSVCGPGSSGTGLLVLAGGANFPKNFQRDLERARTKGGAQASRQAYPLGNCPATGHKRQVFLHLDVFRIDRCIGAMGQNGGLAEDGHVRSITRLIRPWALEADSKV
jgi:hypothetical protein